ncbi:MAG: zinc ribbon domain-containing protein [Anaerolineae bacterium]|nr:zinc ribbon domain-containing protein [Anaerolineae bacterium]
MNCTACGTPNRDLARFCRGCGLWLLPRCPFCNLEIPKPSAFCDQCGRRISDWGSATQRHSDRAIRRFNESANRRPFTKFSSTDPRSPILNPRSPISNP